MDRPVFTPIQIGGDGKLDRVQSALADAFAELEDRLQQLRAPGVLLATGTVRVGLLDQVVDYRGAGGDDVLLPEAGSLGVGKSRALYVMNNGRGAINLRPRGGGNLLDGSAGPLSLAIGDSLLATDNGKDAWAVLRTQLPQTAPIVASEWYSPVDAAAYFFGQSAANVTNHAGNQTSGDKFSSSRALIATGVRFFWKSPGSNKTIRARIYGASSPVGSVDIAVSASGVYTATFAAPVALNAYQDYAAAIYETGGGSYTAMDSTTSGPFAAVPITGMIQTGPFTIARSFCRWVAASAVPNATATTEFYPVEPIFAPFSLE